jgi:hypothetical protein
LPGHFFSESYYVVPRLGEREEEREERERRNKGKDSSGLLF